MNKLFVLATLIAALLGGCSKNDFPVIENQKNVEIRTIIEAKSLASNYQLLHSENPLKANKSFSSTGKVQALTVGMLQGAQVNFNGKSSTGDTLLYYVPNEDGGMIVSRNKACLPVLAILDNNDFSFENILNNKQENIGIFSFLLSALDYNNSPETLIFPPVDLPNDGSDGGSTKGPVTLVDEVLPKVPVQWGQSGDPFDRYTPSHYPSGCVATAVAQAFTVTRHIGMFNNVPLNFDDLIHFRNRGFLELFPNQADIVGRFMREIGVAVDMKYTSDGSGARTSDGAKLFSDFGMNISRNKADIKKTLRTYSNGIILIGSRTEKDFLGIPKGTGHAYLADGYRVFSDGTDMIHVNYGWGPSTNGYFLTVLNSPHWTDDAPKTYPHEWEFYCIYR
ncbi:C10 family peptidase [Sphingobacterium sp. Lzh-3]|uniref:C10 family peptidase n=1 Tax=Sphingobacterium sp. Lzh-3 TaxID=3382150 RepID=UPI00398CEA6E